MGDESRSCARYTVVVGLVNAFRYFVRSKEIRRNGGNNGERFLAQRETNN